MMEELRPAFSVLGHALKELQRNQIMSKAEKQEVREEFSLTAT